MHYIVLDIEMNGRKFKSDKPMETIEIGAVKLNRDMKIIDVFTSVIKPVYFKQLNNFIRELTGIKQKEIDAASGFKKVFLQFQAWCGVEEFTFVTWGSEDIKNLIQDSKLHNVTYSWIEKPFIDLIKNIETHNGLRNTMEHFGVKWEGEQHRALSDALNTCKLFTVFNRENYVMTDITELFKIAEKCLLNSKRRYRINKYISYMVENKIDVNWNNFSKYPFIKALEDEKHLSTIYDYFLTNIMSKFENEKELLLTHER